MPVYHKQQAAQFIQAPHEVRGIFANIFRNIPGLYQQFHSRNVEHLADTCVRCRLDCAQQLLGILLELIHAYISNIRAAVGRLCHSRVTALPVYVLLCFLCDIEHVAFGFIAMCALQRVLKHQLSYLRNNIVLPYNMQRCLFGLHRFGLAGGIGHHILRALCIHLYFIVVLALIVVQRKLDGLNCAALKFRQLCLTPAVFILALLPMLCIAGGEHYARVLRNSYRSVSYDRTYDIGISNVYCFITVGRPGLTRAYVLQ